MKEQEIKHFLIQLLDREMKEEFDYRATSDKDTSYITDCVIAKRWLLGKGNTGMDKLINHMIIEEDIKKYINGIGKED